MKTFITILLCLLLFSCNQTGDKISDAPPSSNEDTPTASSSKKEVVTKGGILSQHGDYTVLFEREPKDCNFINAEGLAKAIQVSPTTIENPENNCTYILTEANGNKTRFYFTVEAWGNNMVLKEIKSAKDNAETFGKDSKLSQYRISETGDTYLSMHQDRMIRILNEKNKNAIILFYSPEPSTSKGGVENANTLKDTALERSYAIANYILKNHN